MLATYTECSLCPVSLGRHAESRRKRESAVKTGEKQDSSWEMSYQASWKCAESESGVWWVSWGQRSAGEPDPKSKGRSAEAARATRQPSLCHQAGSMTTPDQAKLPMENCSTSLPSISNPPVTSHLAFLVLACSYLFIYCCQWWFFFTANHWCISHPSFHDP